MFHNGNLRACAQIINQAVDDLLINLQSAAKTGEQVDMHQQLGRMTMQVIGAAAFGYDCLDCYLANRSIYCALLFLVY